jgi:hypothetical protein
MTTEKYVGNTSNTEKCILLILGTQVRRKESNDVKLPMKWIVNFKRGKIEFECGQ